MQGGIAILIGGLNIRTLVNEGLHDLSVSATGCNAERGESFLTNGPNFCSLGDQKANGGKIFGLACLMKRSEAINKALGFDICPAGDELPNRVYVTARGCRV
eukprot:GDKJ01017135.1.p2 GENE.GDKJ01017135.1~~GDKJ01017135.1.p2  ORF type:complete len:102 (-),score=4.06 GDKJ01017135.1:25-330(-)